MRKVKKKVLGGGAWRAWVRRSSLGGRGSPNLAVLAQGYREAKQEGLETIDTSTKLGAMATTAAQLQQGRPGGSSFGLKTRRLAALKWQQHCVAFHKATQHLTDFDLALACLKQVQGTGDIGTALRLARSSARLENKKVALQRKQAEDSLSQYHNTHGVDACKELQQALPVLQRHDIKRVAEGAFPVFELQNKKLQEIATQLCSWSCGNRSTNFGPGLDKLWHDLHRTVDTGLSLQGESEEDIQELSLKPSICREAGVCLCTGQGLLLKRCRDEVLKKLKSSFSLKASKDLLLDGHIFLKITEVVEEGDADPIVNWYHISLMSLSPYQPTLQKVIPLSVEEEHFYPDYVYLQAGQGESTQEVRWETLASGSWFVVSSGWLNKGGRGQGDMRVCQAPLPTGHMLLLGLGAGLESAGPEGRLDPAILEVVLPWRSGLGDEARHSAC